jgi:hypothetical protein
MADLLSYLRCVAQVWETSEGSDYDYRKSEREVPRRAITCLKNLAKGHGMLTGRNSITLEDIPMIIKTALDTASIERVSMFSLLIANNGILTTDQVLESLNVSKPTALKTMAEFEAIGLVTSEEFNDGGVGRPSKRIVLNPRFNWFLSDGLIKKIIPHTPINFNSNSDLSIEDNTKTDNGNSTQLYLFWHTYDELQKEEAAHNYTDIDKSTVSGKKLEECLISTGKFYNGDAARMIKEMVRVGKLEEVMIDTYRRI